MGKSSNFLELLRTELLSPRFDALCEHGEQYVLQNFDVISQRMLWYNAVDLFKAKYGTDQIDLIGKPLEQYNKFLKAIEGFCVSKKVLERAGAVNKRYVEYWGILRKALGIEAKGRAICYGVIGNDIIVTPANKNRYINGGLMAVICEKETLGRKWLAEMENRGYNKHFILIVTQGFSSCEVIETLMEIKENIQKGATNFYVGILHDLDLAGVNIIEDVRQYFPVFDMGVNFDMIDQATWDNLKESTNYNENQQTYMANNGLGDLAKRIGDYRLELDNLYVKSGIAVFCDYAEKVIKEKCKNWDLNRVSKPRVYAPTEYDNMRERVDGLWHKIVKAATGNETYELHWTECANDEYNKMLGLNRSFSGDILNYDSHISEQSNKLQNIVDNDPENVAKISAIRELYNKLNIDQLEELFVKEDEDSDSDDSNESDSNNEE